MSKRLLGQSKEVMTVAKAQNCGCGCLDKSKPQDKGTKKAK
jgi:hypothetical protein